MLQRVMMDVVVEHGQGGEVPVYLYKAVPGSASASFGLHCAQLAGMDAEVVSRAQAVLRHWQQQGGPPPAAPMPAQVRGAGSSCCMAHAQAQEARVRRQLQLLVALVQAHLENEGEVAHLTTLLCEA